MQEVHQKLMLFNRQRDWFNFADPSNALYRSQVFHHKAITFF